jgi:hypothetical protein
VAVNPAQQQSSSSKRISSKPDSERSKTSRSKLSSYCDLPLEQASTHKPDTEKKRQFPDAQVDTSCATKGKRSRLQTKLEGEESEAPTSGKSPCLDDVFKTFPQTGEANYSHSTLSYNPSTSSYGDPGSGTQIPLSSVCDEILIDLDIDSQKRLLADRSDFTLTTDDSHSHAESETQVKSDGPACLIVNTGNVINQTLARMASKALALSDSVNRNRDNYKSKLLSHPYRA